MPSVRVRWWAIAAISLLYAMATRPFPIFLSSLLLSAYVTWLVWAWLDLVFSRDHIMAGYKNRFIRLEFPELGDDIWVDIMNPMTAPASILTSDIPTETGDEGNVAKADGSRSMDITYDITSKLVIRWNVYDALDLSETPQPMELPATCDKMKRLPMVIVTRIMQEVGKGTGRLMPSTSTTS